MGKGLQWKMKNATNRSRKNQLQTVKGNARRHATTLKEGPGIIFPVPGKSTPSSARFSQSCPIPSVIMTLRGCGPHARNLVGSQPAPFSPRPRCWGAPSPGHWWRFQLGIARTNEKKKPAPRFARPIAVDLIPRANPPSTWREMVQGGVEDLLMK